MNDDERRGDIDTLGAKHNDPREVGPCRIEARISTTATSRVYRAVDTELQRTVVVKVLSPPYDEQPAVVQRFQEASQALLGVVTPHLVSVLRTGLLGRSPYVVFEYLDGEDLDRAARRERALVPSVAVRAVLDASQGLAAALERGVVHGDVRPRHMMRTRGTTKVTGFSLSPPLRTAQNRTLPGNPAYLAPELAQGRSPDGLSDIYALGCTLYELVCGKSPYGHAGADALVACHAHEPFPTFVDTDKRLPDELDALLLRMVAKARDRRFQTHVELLQAGAAVLPALRRQRPEDPAVVIEEGRDAGLRVPIPEGDLLLGRVPGEGISVDDGRCSRRHAMIRRAGDYIEVEDLGSRNGIKVNGAEVRSRQLFPGDRIQIGDTVLRIDGPPQAVQQMPALKELPASPLRGAFGDVEVSHPPALQLTVEQMADPAGTGAAARLRVLARLAPLMAARRDKPAELQKDVLAIVSEAVGADERAFVRIDGGQPRFEAKSGAEAQVLSCVLPALERALPGQVSLATSVRVGTDDRWAVLLAPLINSGTAVAYLIVVKKSDGFPEGSLGVLEGSCALLGLRASSA